MVDGPYLSVIIPVHNEQDDVAELASLLRTVLDHPHEIIFVDDGSTDATWERLRTLHEPGRVRLLRLRRNFGKTAALCAGFAAARGQVVVTMDGDLQDDPREVPRFLERLADGSDLVVGWKKRRHDPSSKVVASRIFNFAVSSVTGLKLHDINCGFKAFRREVLRSLCLHGEMHRFIPVLAAARGFQICEIEVVHHPRKHGRSKYGLERLFKGFLDLITVTLITRFGERPAHGFGIVALPLLAAGVATGVLCFLLQSRWEWAFLAAILSLAGCVFLAAGWVAEVVVAQRRSSKPLPAHGSYDIEEQLD
jgi:glycosyltransferase involved in cell wall biosynthesis